MHGATPQPAAPARPVLVTRPAEQAGGTAARLRALGFAPVLAPLLHVSVRPLTDLPRHDAVLVTSGNAVGALPVGAAPVLAVGDATAARAQQAGFQDVRSAQGDAPALVALARASLRPGATLLLASGAGQGAAVAAALRQAGFRVHRRTAYAARPVTALPDAARHLLQQGGLHAALFLSAETARTFVRLLPRPLHPALAGADALAIGAPAAAALAPLPFRRVRVPLYPTLEELLRLL